MGTLMLPALLAGKDLLAGKGPLLQAGPGPLRTREMTQQALPGR